MALETIKRAVKNMMDAMHHGKFTIEELEFLERFYKEGAIATGKVLERARKEVKP